MSKKAFVITGLGYGDEGKGKVTLWLSSKHKAHTVIRTGGPQAMHRVVTSDGHEHVHAQFGSGTLAGARTHLSKNMVIDPYAIISEGRSLQKEHGIRDIFDKITIHEDALVITPFHAIANRLKELSRSDKRYGSVGVGVGETVLDAEAFPEEAIRAKDLYQPNLKDKLESIQKRKILELEEIISRIDKLPETLRDRAHFEAANLQSEKTIEWALSWFIEIASLVGIVDTSYVAEKILGRSGTVIFEGSQGVLLDRFYGFHPYTTKVRTIPETALSLLKECDYDGEVTSLGVLRAYHTRHGGGPFVTESTELTRCLPDPSNQNHQWQGNFRVGCFDVVLAKYAVEVCKGQLDGLVVTCVDRIQSLGRWEVCRSYSDPHINPFFISDFFLQNSTDEIIGIKVSDSSGRLQIERQEELGRFLYQCFPNIEVLKITDPLFIGFQFIRDELNIPVYAVSTGPMNKDCIELKYQIDLGILQ
ncbi:MAG: hypothetical protein A3B86_03590 [Candidatus Yanofskybacteria bacterium RIFCSPHIGHO2_02_FULL_38_22b]|uniref:Adenylosuccinate synthetase n=1 Tax=Candidatus Yanofskybacteria bacterium RIFCSPHIGHO2_02_FULL_38_22b TaxID=1802673 RepID=A0A1F8F070_9BACT|nr:MAG: hypothetical protein A3B86_03590 [Candidatus Yanofskybacteria bacterium RIFCSPHIGHO2_02_FULL_38_22b]OGN19468.1 MAG: hypothetical protein A2910_02970 [Candidatus Yanofskybacteria bacterium RIFCSPLOWO2_01_FULL_39_28]